MFEMLAAAFDVLHSIEPREMPQMPVQTLFRQSRINQEHDALLDPFLSALVSHGFLRCPVFRPHPCQLNPDHGVPGHWSGEVFLHQATVREGEAHQEGGMAHR